MDLIDIKCRKDSWNKASWIRLLLMEAMVFSQVVSTAPMPTPRRVSLAFIVELVIVGGWEERQGSDKGIEEWAHSICLGEQ